MQKFMQILATLALLLVLALVIPLTLAACGGTRTEAGAAVAECEGLLPPKHDAGTAT